MSIDQLMWVEKYRPKSLDELVNQEGVKERLRLLLERKEEMPHLLFAGPPGSGKTTTALIIARQLLGESWSEYTLSLNASDERGIDMIRERVKTFSRFVDRREGIPFRLIILDEADEMCLHPETEVLVGRIENIRKSRLKDLLRKYAHNYFSIPSLNPVTGMIENDIGRIVESGSAMLYEITLDDGRSILASKRHPLFILENGVVGMVRVGDLRQGDKIIDLKDNFLQCNYCDMFIPKFKMELHYCDSEKDRFDSGVIQISSSKHIVSAHSRLGSAMKARISMARVRSIEERFMNEVLNISVIKNKNFILGNGILTHNTSDAQTALRRIMEESSRYTRFILICNYSSGIIEPIQSRCAIFRFQRLDETSVTQHLREIAKKEGVNIMGEDVYSAIYEATSGDLRQAINLLQAASLDGTVTLEKVKAITGATVKGRVTEIVKLALDGMFEEAMTKMLELTKVYGVPERDFLKFANEAILALRPEEMGKAIRIIAEYDYRLIQGAQADIQLTAMLSELSSLRKERS